MTLASAAWRHEPGRVVIRFRLTPGARSDGLEGLAGTAEGPAIKARVRAIPEDGAANRALELLVASWLDVPKSRVAVVGGPKSRVKLVAVDGTLSDLNARLASLQRG